MKFKDTVPYILLGLTAMCGMSWTTAYGKRDADKKFATQSNITIPSTNIYTARMESQEKITTSFLNAKADTLCQTYVSNMLTAHARLHPLLGTSRYHAAVCRELPGAPVGRHCMWGQHTQLSRALKTMGDTVTIIPRTARTACTQFKHQMRNKYRHDTGCIYEGRVYESDASYNAALNRHLTRKKIDTTTPDSIRQSEIDRFAAHNFNADRLAPGTIMIVPRTHGNTRQFHAITFLGRGRIQDGKFMADSLGRHIYVGHNREVIGDLFRTYDMSNVFAADTRQIASAQYRKELQHVLNMPYDDLIKFLADSGHPETLLRLYPRSTLVHMARNKYFKLDTPEYLSRPLPVIGKISSQMNIYQWPITNGITQRHL